MEERDRLTKDLDTVKNERDKKIDEMKKQFDREKELLKQTLKQNIWTYF